MKKKLILLATIVALFATLLIGSTALAADTPDTVITTWSGSGHVDVYSNSGDTESGIDTAGAVISGTYTVTDRNDDPYSYGVDTYDAVLTAHVENGWINSGSTRLTSKVSMYGDPGQKSWSYVYVEDGEADMAYRTWTNYASLKDPGYTYQLPGGHNIVVDAAYYEIDRGVQASDGGYADLDIAGSGTSVLDCMCSEAGSDSVRLGWGCGCYTDANFSATGSGTFDLLAVGEDVVTFPSSGGFSTYGDGTPGSASINLIATWSSSFSIADYSVSAD